MKISDSIDSIYSLDSFFPHAAQISLREDLQIHYQMVLDFLGPLLTAERREKIERVVGLRNFQTAVVLDGIYDRGNISAVMRTAEGLGFANFHVIETQERFKEANRVTQGADKWTEVRKWKTPREAAVHLKSLGHRLIVTHLDASKPLQDIDFTAPSALVLGNEKSGVSDAMIELADERVRIPMTGFVQSFNISVAGALCLYEIHRQQQDSLAQRLTPEQQGILRAHYYLRTLDSGKDMLIENLTRQGGPRHMV